SSTTLHYERFRKLPNCNVDIETVLDLSKPSARELSGVLRYRVELESLPDAKNPYALTCDKFLGMFENLASSGNASSNAMDRLLGFLDDSKVLTRSKLKQLKKFEVEIPLVIRR